ncbi:hypothetical protein OUE_0100 [Helicobacter pylori R030b]|nr:hypothetical protein OUE_0100 [Helicobacter pylori R030b]
MKSFFFFCNFERILEFLHFGWERGFRFCFNGVLMIKA